MKLDSLKDKGHTLAVVLIVASVLLGVLVLIKVAAFYMASAKAQTVAERAAAHEKGDSVDVEGQLAESKSLADDLKKKNLFAPPVTKQNPVKAVQGIIGNEVLIGDKLYKVGEKIGDAVVVAVGPTKVIIEWNGKKSEFAPMAAASQSPAATRPTVSMPVEDNKKPVVVREPPVTTVKETPAEPVVNDSLGWLGVELPAELKEKFIAKWNSLPDEEKTKAKEEWGRMSDEQKKQAIEMWGRM